MRDEHETERSKCDITAEAVGYIVGRYCGLDPSGLAVSHTAWESDDSEYIRDGRGRIIGQQRRLSRSS
jgi:hypothetical protein